MKKKRKKEWNPIQPQKLFAKPDKNKIYEMPDEYKEYLGKLTEMLDQNEEYKQMLPTLPPEIRAEALPLIRELENSLDEFEQKMADEYEDFQERERKIEELALKKDEAYARLFEHLQRGFIILKHKLTPDEFKKFEKKWTGKWGKAEREEFYELIAHRESYDLENILADPDGKVKRPMKHPQIQMNEAIFEINRVAYVTPEDFKELEDNYEKVVAVRNRIESNLWLFDPEHRPRKRKQIEELDRMIDEVKPHLIAYLNKYLEENGKTEDENADQQKLDAAFDLADVAHERIFIFYKHCQPQLFEKFVPIATSAYDTPEELEAFYKRIAQREANELDEILASVRQKR